MRNRISPRRAHPLALALLACGLLLVCGGLLGCEATPDRQTLTNPFDPDGPTGGDGLQIRAVTSPNQIVLTWSQPQGLGITEYFLYRSDARDGPYTELAVLAATIQTTGNYILNYPDPTRTHWFRAQAFTADGGFSLTSLAVPASVSVGPTVVVGDTVATLATRYPTLTVTASFGDSLRVGFNAAFTNALTFAAGDPNLPTTLSLDLGAAAATDTFRIHVKAFDNLGESVPTVLTLPVNFTPRHRLVNGNPLRLSRRANDLAIPATGVVRMRFAGSEAGLAAATWVAGAEVYPGYLLAESANAQQIWSEYEGDFGFNTTYALNVRPDLLGGATFRLKIPTNRVVSTRTVVAEMAAQATQLRLSESPNFAAVPWQAYADTLSFQLSATEGLKTIYAQFRNDWTQSTVLSDYCTYVSQGPDVKILAPGDASVVMGGSTLLVRGTSSPGTVAAAIDSVRLDLGDGLGFREVIGTDNWQLTWVVPTLAVDTPRVLRARVWAAGTIMTNVVTNVVTVTISQLAVAILNPAPAARIVGGTTVTLTGTAQGLLGGAALDSVVVDIGAIHLVADGATTWSADWEPAVVTADTPAEIRATAWAGGTAVTRTVSVTVTP